MSNDKPGPVWVPVVKARPEDIFASVAERNAVTDAQQDNPRREGESLLSWIERINVAANLMTLSQCQEIERDWREEDVNAIFGEEKEREP